MNRKESILDAATRLFAERGYEATPTAEMARAAGVSEGTIFHHFGTKDGILIHIFRKMTALYIDGMRAEAQKARTGLEALEFMIRFHFIFVEEHSAEAIVIFRDLPSQFLQHGSPHRELLLDYIGQITRLLTQAIEGGQSDGSLREVPSVKTACILRGLLIGLTRQRLLGPPLAISDLSEEAKEFCLRSLARKFCCDHEDQSYPMYGHNKQV